MDSSESMRVTESVREYFRSKETLAGFSGEAAHCIDALALRCKKLERAVVRLESLERSKAAPPESDEGPEKSQPRITGINPYAPPMERAKELAKLGRGIYDGHAGNLFQSILLAVHEAESGVHD